MFNDLVEGQKKRMLDVSKGRTGVMAGALCPPDLMENVAKYLNLREICIAYGQTELSPVSFFTEIDASFEKRTTTCGTIFPHTEAKVVETRYDDEEGCLVVDDNPRVVDVGENGEIWTRGFGVMKGYWNDPEKTAKCLTPDGWLRSGDVGHFDAEGFVKITGRLKDMIIRGGENVFPNEIEAVLRRHPAVIDA
jgi:fatty-acyl-CoA synthase